MSKYVDIPGLYFPVFNPNTGKYGPKITTYLDTFHAVLNYINVNKYSWVTCIFHYVLEGILGE